MELAAIEDLVREGGARVSRRAFVDKDVYELELAHVFARCWLYLGHDSQLREPGDYFTAYMGEDPIIVTRGDDGVISALLNSCQHRGMRVCRSDSGNSRYFRCPYHGWSYNENGKLVGIPRLKTGYFDELDRENLGLVRVPRITNYKGMIWANWDPEAPTFEEYLGGMKVYLDLMLDRIPGGLEAVEGVHKWTIDGNWKFAADNFVGDMYHVPVTHGSAHSIGLRQAWSDLGYQINAGNGHGFGGEYGGLSAAENETSYTPYIKQIRAHLAEQNGDYINKIVPLGHMTIFPNFSALDTLRFRTFRVWNPVGPEKMQVHTWAIFDKALPDEIKQSIRQQYIFTFGPSGVFEQEDGENWSQSTRSTRGWIARQYDLNYSMGAGHEEPVEKVLGSNLPGQMGGIWSEINQRGFYLRWQQLLKADSWNTIREEEKALGADK